MNAIPNRAAFATVRLEQTADEARAALERARVTFATARGEHKATARNAIRRAQRALNAAERGLQAEHQGEAVAPSVQRQTIVDHDGTTLREALVEVGSNKRAQRSPPLDRLWARGSITMVQHSAGRHYRLAWEQAGADSYPIGMQEGGSFGTAPQSGNRRIEDRVGAGAELQRLRTEIGPRGTSVVEHIVVHELDLAGWAAINRCAPGVAMDTLKLTLDLLARVAGWIERPHRGE